ncbi:MAG: hypothetical protein KF789_07550 [Bdellovibrionaceae bacterium]|nr:hypothetical protein [Pseudobdellovibrionaceae bacterium]
MRISLKIGLIILLSNVSTAKADYAMFPRTRLSGQQTYFSGDTGKSFGESGAGYGFGLTVLGDGSYLVPFAGFSATTLAGSQTFLDGTSKVTPKFSFYSASTQLGLQLYPIQRRKKGFNVYVSALGSVGYNYISLNKSVAFTNIPNSDQAFSLGYAAAAGGEWIVSDDGARRWGFFGEISLSKQSATLLKQQFDLSGLTMAVGIGW